MNMYVQKNKSKKIYTKKKVVKLWVIFIYYFYFWFCVCFNSSNNEHELLFSSWILLFLKKKEKLEHKTIIK